jgi:ankyrin repeat protein
MADIPARPSLEHDAKQAKQLLRALRSGTADALERLRLNHPRYRSSIPIPVDLKLADAQLVLAREYGCVSWPAWKQTVQLINADRVERRAALVRSACSSDLRGARTLLARDPGIGATDIYCAAAVGDCEAVERALRQDPAAAHRKGGALVREPLLYATHSRFLRAEPARARGIIDVAGLLLAAGADANAFFLPSDDADPEHRQTPLYGAAGIGNNSELTQLLLDAGADPNDGTVASVGIESLYHAAEFADATCLRLLLGAGPRKSAIDYCLGRALDFAAIDPPMAFLAHGADPNFAVSWFANRTHFHKAIQNGRPVALIRALLDAGADLEKADDRGLTAYRYAVRFGRETIAALLADAGADVGKATASDRLLGSCFAADHGAVTSLLSADPTLVSVIEKTPHQVLACAASHGLVRAVEVMLDLGFAIDAPDEEGMSALHRACWQGDLAMTRLLIGRGASAALPHRYGGDALSTAIRGSINNHEREGGATMRLCDEVAPREYAQVVDLLLSAGAAPPSGPGGSDVVVAVLLRHGVGS